ncbi:MAG TPA: hypothetical protein VHO69_07135 [Phototrophicaceae bacterium]|nr:hypothetical protein [Phototrophicaceae bacterium]
MTELIDRYVRQVGLYVPPRERAEIEAELRSQIQDQLDDRYGAAPSPEEITAVLVELGPPRQIAASYGSQQYLVGPELYPYLLLVLRYCWLVLPAVVIFLDVFEVLASAQTQTVTTLVLDPVLAALQTTLMFSAVVVLIFALIQRSGLDRQPQFAFDPASLPELDDPGVVDRLEVIFGAIFGAAVILVFLYWLRVGGLTLRFDLNNPGDVLPVPGIWLLLLIINSVFMIGVNLLALRLGRWNAGTWLLETVLEVFGAICLYFVIYQPVLEQIMATNADLAASRLDDLPELIVVLTVVFTLLTRGGRLVRLWNYHSSPPAPVTIPTNR